MSEIGFYPRTELCPDAFFVISQRIMCCYTSNTLARQQSDHVRSGVQSPQWHNRALFLVQSERSTV
jgi:hypothetical protein